MTDFDRVRLLFAPYTAPLLKRGDRAFCLYRDCTVVITGWSSARIPWPRCRVLGSRGGCGLLVGEELARAIRHESAAAVLFWWGTSQTGVGNWRRALGVTRKGNEGSARLIQAAAAKGGQAVQDREWTEEQRERARRVNAEKGLAANLVRGCRWPPWTPDEVALLGTAPDEEVARQTNRTPSAVRQKRERLSIPNPVGYR